MKECSNSAHLEKWMFKLVNILAFDVDVFFRYTFGRVGQKSIFACLYINGYKITMIKVICHVQFASK